MPGRSIILSPFLTYNVFRVMFEFGVRFFFSPAVTTYQVTWL